MEHEKNIISYGLRVLKSLKFDFDEKKHIERECKDIISYLNYLENRKLDGDFRAQVVSTESLISQLNDKESQLATLNKRISNEVGCVCDIEENISRKDVGIRLSYVWHNNYSKIDKEIKNFLTNDENKQVSKNKESEKEIEF